MALGEVAGPVVMLASILRLQLLHTYIRLEQRERRVLLVPILGVLVEPLPLVLYLPLAAQGGGVEWLYLQALMVKEAWEAPVQAAIRILQVNQDTWALTMPMVL
jgi:hypothetical protein